MVGSSGNRRPFFCLSECSENSTSARFNIKIIWSLESELVYVSCLSLGALIDGSDSEWYLTTEMTTLRCRGLAERIAQYRRTHKLSLAALAERAGMSPQGLQLIEKGRVMATVETLDRLAKATNLDPGWLGFGLSTPSAPHIIITPEFDADRLITDMLAILKGPSGVIDDVYKYLDPVSAHEWRSMLRQPDFSSVIASFPMAELTELLSGTVGTETPTDIIGLGCGTGEREVALIKRLRARQRRDLRLILLDISVNLLGTAVLSSSELSNSHSIPVLGLLGDFHSLSEYCHLLTGDGPRRRVLTMFGYTFSNLDNEVQFLRRSLSWVNHEDFLVLDLPAAATDSSDPAEIVKRDRTLARKRGGDWHSLAFQFLTGPLRRNLDGILECKVQTELDQSSCVIPGSYAVVHRATVRLRTGEEKRFVIGYSKRYVLDKLAKHMEGEGWRLVDGLQYGPDNAALLGVFQRHDPRPKRGRRPK